MRVVAIGASAGGLEALAELFGALPPETGMAFVVIQHLSPDHPSIMHELIARYTAMPVAVAEQGDGLVANRVYVMPRGKEMIVRGGTLVLADRAERGLSLPIDTFFRSLAQDAGPRAVAVVVSGTGADGSRGVVEVKHAGGVVLVESPTSAAFDGMPRAAIDSGSAHHIGSCTELARELTALPPINHVQATELADTEATRALFDGFHTRFGIDVHAYRVSAIARRARLAPASPDDLDATYRDLMVGETRMFRDPEAFAALERAVVPRVLDAVGRIRVWAPGCATGEEAYTLAIVLAEAFAARGRRLDLEVIGTDVHEPSLAFARAGRYAASRMIDVSDARLAKWFHPVTGDVFEVAPELRRLVRFQRNDVTRDAPPTRVHLVSCRNLLVYLQPDACHAVMTAVEFALVPGGYLFLGAGETPPRDELACIDERWKLFQKRRPVGARPNAVVAHDDAITRDELLDLFAPPGFLVDDTNTLIDSFGGAERLCTPARRPSPDLLELLDGEVRIAVRRALERAFATGLPVSYTNIPVELDGAGRATVRVRLLAPRPGRPRAAIVTFEDLVDPEVLSAANEEELTEASESRRELVDARAMTALVDASGVAVLELDRDLCALRWTPRMGELLGFEAGDVGRHVDPRALAADDGYLVQTIPSADRGHIVIFVPKR